MKQLIVKLLLIVVVVLSAFSPIVAGGPTAIPSAHAVQHTYQIAGIRCQPFANPNCLPH
jgi:hypothetical protein